MTQTTLPRASARGVAPRQRRRSGWVLLLLALLAIVMAVGLSAGAVVHQARQYDNTPTDAIVVLGAAQYSGEPSPVFANRLDHAAELYQAGVANQIVTVGGKVPGDFTSEAEVGAEYLVSQGVPRSAIVVVAKGRDTLGSFRPMDRLERRYGWESLTIVSDRSHLARSSAIADAMGFDAHVSGPASGDGSTVTPIKVGIETAGLLRFAAYDRWQLEGRV